MNTKVTIVKDEKQFDTTAAWRIIGCMLDKPSAVIGLSTGQTTKNMHHIVSEIYTASPFDVSDITLFGLDEITGVPRDYDGACYTMIKTQIADALGICDTNFIMPATLSDNYDVECRKFQSELERRGGIDLQILGLGTNGHLGFNQPGTPFESQTWVSRMDEALETRVRKETGILNAELGGLTLGIKNIMHARRIVLAAKGKSKAAIVKQMLCGPVTTDIPASILQLHPNCEFLLDEAAAAML
ncbi:MAG: glucosamine-6-phosphate deaminase [Cytophagaceae bacterium]|jgi:glucosamine-6-phosphate deaminase|nr:glucosamine-6-phosphate deaminase [Cytophagaceae bacterium]